MKLPLIALLSVVIAAPVVTVPTYADGQVLTGRGAARRSAPRPRPAPVLSDAEYDQMYAAQDQIADIDTERAAIIAAGEAAGGLTEAQRLAIEDLDVRRAAAQEVYERLQGKLNR
jgi:hypothetical protein